MAITCPIETAALSEVNVGNPASAKRVTIAGKGSAVPDHRRVGGLGDEDAGDFGAA